MIVDKPNWNNLSKSIVFNVVDEYLSMSVCDAADDVNAFYDDF